MNLGMRNNILEKLLELFSQMPDQEGEKESGEMGEMSEMAEGMPEKGKLEVMAISAKPKGEKDDLMKGC